MDQLFEHQLQQWTNHYLQLTEGNSINEIESIKDAMLIDVIDLADFDSSSRQSYLYVTNKNTYLRPSCYKVGFTTIDEYNKMQKLSTCVPHNFTQWFRINLGMQTLSNRYRLEYEFFNLIPHRYEDKELFTCSQDEMLNAAHQFVAHHPQFKIEPPQ